MIKYAGGYVCSSGIYNYCNEKGLAIIGHSGYYGFFVKGESGFCRNEYPKEKLKPEVTITADAALISDLQKPSSRNK